MPLAYDEANNYLPDGGERCSTEDFWRSVRREDIASIHLKQKNGNGTLPRLGEGYVDIHVLVHRLVDFGYTKDLLFELAPTEAPLEDALHGRDYVAQILAG